MRALASVIGLLLTCVLGAPPARAEPAPNVPPRYDVIGAATKITTAWLGGNEERLRTLVLTPMPDRFRVIMTLALRTEDEGARRRLLDRVATILETKPSHRGAAALARIVHQAQPDELTREGEAAKRYGALQEKLDPKHPQRVLPPTEDLPPLGGWSVANGAMWLVRLQALVRTKPLDAILPLADQLAAHAKTRGWHELGVRVEVERAMAYRRAGKRMDALAAYREVATLGRQMGDAGNEQMGLQNAIILSMHLGLVAQRYALGLRLREVAEGHAPPNVIVGTEVWLLDCETRLSDYKRAEVRAKRVMAEAAALDDVRVAQIARNFLLDVYTAQGRFPEALALAQQIRDDEPFDDAQRARQSVTIARLYSAVNRPEDALAMCEAALATVESEKQLAMTAFATVLSTKASLLRKLGRRAEARTTNENAATLFKKHGQLARYVATLGLLVQADLEEGLLEDARTRTEEMVANTSRLGPQRRTRIFRLQGRVEVESGNGPAAVAAFDRAIAEAKKGEPRPFHDAYLLAGRGRAQLLTGDRRAATRSLRAATEMLVNVVTGVGERHALGLRDQARDVAAAGFRAALALADSDAANATQHLTSAWWFREAGHALLLAETIRNSDALAMERVEAQDRADEEAALKALARAQTIVVTAAQPSEADAARFQAAQMAYREVALRLDANARPEGEWQRASPMPLRAFQEALAKDAAAVAYMVVGERLYALCVRHDRVSAKDLGRVDQTRKAIDAWRTLASAPDGPTDTVGARLYDTLLRPFASDLQGVRTLIVLPDGPVAYLPFGSLVAARDKEGRAKTYVLDRMAVSYVPSGSVRRALGHMVRTRAPGRGLLAVGDPAYGRAREALSGTRAEVNAIARRYPAKTVLLGKDATLAAWHEALDAIQGSTLRAVHLACHGLVDPENPRLSGLVFAGGEVLNVELIHRRRMVADLVVLSACETAAGSYQRGEGVLGLARAFFQIGTPRVVVTAWPVSDAATSQLMTSFHEMWSRPGSNSAEALRAARLALRNSDGRLAHPFYWAPFVHWGP